MFIYNEKSEIIGIEKNYKNKVIWINISRYQKLSENFIREMKDKVNWDYILFYQDISDDFSNEFKYKINQEEKPKEKEVFLLTKQFEFKYIEV